MASERQELNLTFTHRGVTVLVSVPSNSSLKQLGERVQQLTGILPDTMKLLVPQGPRTALKPFSDEHAGLNIHDCSISEGKNVRLMGTSQQELIDVARQQKASDRMIGFDEEDYRARQRLKPVGRSLKLPEGQYVFASFRTLDLPGVQMSPPPAQALRLMHALASDRGIVAIMSKYRWRVGIMSEMAPEGLVGISPVCLLGLNKNRGEEISLRLRTDDLKGFRKYESIRKTLLHELAHMVHDEHDDNFYRLDRQLNREVVELDWTKSKGQSVSGIQETAQTSIDEEVLGLQDGQRVGGSRMDGSVDARTAAAIAALTRYNAKAEPDSDDKESSHSMEEDSKATRTVLKPFRNVGRADDIEAFPAKTAAETEPDPDDNGEPDPDDMIADEVEPEARPAEAEPDPDDNGEVFPDGYIKINQRCSSKDVEPDPDDTMAANPVHEPDPEDKMAASEPDPDDTMAASPVHELDPDDTSMAAQELVQTDDPELQRIVDVTKAARGRLQNTLEKLKMEAHPSDVNAACQTLLAILSNIMEHPNDEKYRRLRKTNPVFYKRVARFQAALEVLQVVGFTDEASYEDYFVLKHSDPGLLWLARSCLEAAA